MLHRSAMLHRAITMMKLKLYLRMLYRHQRKRKRNQLKESSNRRVKPDTAPLTAPPPHRRYIFFQAESEMGEIYEDEPHVVQLYYAVKVVGPSYYESRNDLGEELPEIRPIFITECEYSCCFGFGSAIYTLGNCCCPQHMDDSDSCRERTFQCFSFAGDNAQERSWIALPRPSGLRFACAAASLNGRLYLFGTRNTQFGFVDVDSDNDYGDEEDEDEYEDEDEDEDARNPQEPWLKIFDPVAGRWAAPSVQPPLFPDSVSMESPMYAVGWPPNRILLSSLSTDHFPCKFGYNVIGNRWEHVYLESEDVSASVPDEALLVNDGTFYYVDGELGELCAYEIGSGASFAAPLEDTLAAKAEEGLLDLLHIDGDRFCFIWDEEHNTVHKLLHCMKFTVSKVVDTSAREALGVNGSLEITTEALGVNGSLEITTEALGVNDSLEITTEALEGSLEITVFSHKSFLVDNFISRGRANWLEGDWERINQVPFDSPMREMIRIGEPESTETIASMVDEIRRKMRQRG
ncbi:uncharacterized protein LOC110012891 [Sesamum indicum]|uniref:Uncharacterized protein LOC110012891 n=1 Tax=Sesamum indicum TaxID=4182 RepID=A0A8M8V506_SESIN|nr:uncharacterized protein LOC110012891 [Sesamum indicum]